jgi:hypothetical protein
LRDFRGSVDPCRPRGWVLPHFGERRLPAITTFETRDWMLELHEAGDYPPKTLNNALEGGIGRGAERRSAILLAR